MSKLDLRKKTILQTLSTKTELNVQVASELIGTSPATTRRLFSQMAAEELVFRVHGGIRLLPEAKGTYSYILSNMRGQHKKALIASRAATMVETGDLLFLDSGTTILKMAEALSGRLRNGDLNEIVVVTNSLVSYEQLCPDCRVILVGGEVRLSRRDTFGRIAEKALASLHVRKSFFGADGVHPERGLMATDEWTCHMNDIVGKNSDSIIVLADSEKFGKSSLLTYSALEAVQVIITDDGISEEALQQYRNAGANIEVVSA